MKHPKLFLTAFLLFFAAHAIAQDVNLDSLLEVDTNKKIKNETHYTEATFKTTRLIDGHTVETTQAGILDFKVSHRFGNVNDGLYQMFGLDQATMRLGFDYGINNRLTIGIGRSTFEKQYDGFIKYRALWQSAGKNNIPVSVTLLSSIMIKTLHENIDTKKVTTQDKTSYAYQVMVARKFSECFSLQLMPTLIHENLVDSASMPNDLYSIGAGARVKLTKNSSINAEYYYQIPDNKLPATYNTLSLGWEIQTAGHVFSLHLSNSIGMTERTFIAENREGRWGFGDKGSIHFGFNISRVFTIKKPKEAKR
ncbi:MAG: DUF5777 family beta-barrel protein [Parafilimonas sp.]